MNKQQCSAFSDYVVDFLKSNNGDDLVEQWKKQEKQHSKVLNKVINKTNKPKKDPNAPKKGMSAFMYFSRDNRDKVKSDNPDITFGELGKELGQRWRALSDKEKAKYQKMAEKDKERYNTEMDKYTPSAEFKKKEPVGPKRAKSSYLYFCQEHRAKVVAKDPEMKLPEVSKELGRMWRELDDKKKEKYQKLAEKDKARYNKEKEDGVQEKQEAAEPEPEKKAVKQTTKTSSGFVLFGKEKRKEVKANNLNKKPPAVTALLKQMWNELSEEEQEEWHSRANN